MILDNAGGQAQGVAIAKAGAAGPDCLTDQSQRVRGALVQGFTVNGFDSDGIFLFCVDNWRVAGNSVNDNAEYGIFPSHCGPGEVVHNVATGSNDTGIYVGQSHDVRVDQNLATGNVSGFELENSSHSRVDHNESTGNTGGILTFTNIFLDVKQNADNRVDHNVVTGNASFGIAVANFCVATNLAPEQCAALDIEPNPDFDQVLFNVATGNGAAPSPLINPVFAVDLAWDTTGTDNCWENNVAGTQFPAQLPTCH